jgi:hypothetical protein
MGREELKAAASTAVWRDARFRLYWTGQTAPDVGDRSPSWLSLYLP